MPLIHTCTQEQNTLLSKWIGDFLSHHGIGAVGVSRTVNDQFLNPVGHTVKAAITIIYQATIGEDIDSDELKKSVYELVRIQAVQALSPAQALLPIVQLKTHLYTLLEKQIKSSDDFVEYKTMADRLDTILLMAFDMYAQDKEVLYKVRVQELKSAQSQILRFAQSKGYEAE